MDLALSRITSSLKENWFGPHPCLCPLQPWEPWFPGLAPLERVISRPADMLLFVEPGSGIPRLVRYEENVAWVLFRTSERALQGLFFRDGQVRDR